MTAEDAAVDVAAKQRLAERVLEKMLKGDTFSQWMGVKSLEVGPGRSVLSMQIRDDMLNGHGGVHGAIVYSLADCAFSFAANNDGIVSVGIDCSMSYPAASRVGDTLIATAVVEAKSNRLSYCNVTVRTQDDTVVGLFRGTVYRTQKPHFPDQ